MNDLDAGKIFLSEKGENPGKAFSKADAMMYEEKVKANQD